jgi:hypothetical protein
MSKHSATRFYLRQPGGAFSRLFWIQNIRANEMLLGAYSLLGKPATITHEFSEVRHSPGDSKTSQLKWAEATPVTLPVDHFTCHADGSFHVKARSGPTLYSHTEEGSAPLGPDSPVFLDVLITSDIVSRYATIADSPKYPHVWFAVPADGVVSLNAMFSGAQFPLKDEALSWIAAGGREEGAVTLRAGMFQAVVWGSPRPISPAAAASRPPGTLFMFHWRRGLQTVGLKAFVLD